MLGSWGRMVWRSTLGVLGSLAMTPKANILRVSMSYIRVWGHCSFGLQSITFKFCISASGTDKTVIPEGLEWEQGLPSILSQDLSVALGSLRSVLLPTGIMETQPVVQLCVPHCIVPVPPLERQVLTW